MVPLRGGTRLIRYLSTAELMQELWTMYAVWPSPFQASRTPEARSCESAWAQRNGVAKSLVVPTTKIDNAPLPRSRAGLAAGTNQYAHGRLPHMSDAPNMDAFLA